jgi:uncharacterized protein (DUF433 family)
MQPFQVSTGRILDSLSGPAQRLKMFEWSECPSVERDPKVCEGAWTFRGTRVPVSALFQNLESGATVTEFLEWFPGVGRIQVNQVLEFAASSVAG